MEWFWILAMVGCAGVFYMMATGRITSTLMSGEPLDSTIDREFGILPYVKPHKIRCPNGYGHYFGKRYNKSGSIDIITTNGRWIYGVDADKNIRRTANVLTELEGKDEIFINIELDTGRVVEWQTFMGLHDNSDHLVDLVDQSKRHLVNVLSQGFSPLDKNLHFEKLEEETKNIGKILKNLGKAGGYTQPEIRMSRPISQPHEEDGYGE